MLWPGAQTEPPGVGKRPGFSEVVLGKASSTPGSRSRHVWRLLADETLSTTSPPLGIKQSHPSDRTRPRACRVLTGTDSELAHPGQPRAARLRFSLTELAVPLPLVEGQSGGDQ